MKLRKKCLKCLKRDFNIIESENDTNEYNYNSFQIHTNYSKKYIIITAYSRPVVKKGPTSLLSVCVGVLSGRFVITH